MTEKRVRKMLKSNVYGLYEWNVITYEEFKKIKRRIEDLPE